MTEIIIPERYPGDDEYIALVVRMRIAGAWDPKNDWLVRTNDPDFNKGMYAQFINDCVGYVRTNRIEAAVATYDYWVVCPSLFERGFTSLKDQRSYVVRKS